MLALLGDPVVAPGRRPTRHSLARLEAGELDGEARAQVEAAMSESEPAQRLMRELEADREAFRVQHPRAAFLEALDARRGRRSRTWWWAPAGVLAAAAAAVALTWVPTQQTAAGVSVAPVAPVTRLKAAPGLTFHVERDGRVQVGDAGGVYHPGDRIQLRYTTGTHRHLVVVSLDSSGAVTPFYDADGRSLDIEPGVKQLLDGSVTLDGALGPERILGCFSERSVDTGEIIEAGRRALAAAGGDPAKVARLDIGCAQATFLIDKRRRER